MSVIYADDASIKIGGIVLPGLYKNIEVSAEAAVEEQDIEGCSVKPKQAVGYEDAKIIIDLELWDGEERTKEDKLQLLQDIFRLSGQDRPEAWEIVSTHSRIRQVDRVILKNMTSAVSNKKDMISVRLELWEYIPVTLATVKSTVKGGGAAAIQNSMGRDYQSQAVGGSGEGTLGKAVGRRVSGKNTITWDVSKARRKDTITGFAAHVSEGNRKIPSSKFKRK